MIEIIKGDCLQSLKKLEDRNGKLGLRNYNDEEKLYGRSGITA